jgi:hypothetical protein
VQWYATVVKQFPATNLIIPAQTPHPIPQACLLLAVIVIENLGPVVNRAILFSLAVDRTDMVTTLRGSVIAVLARWAYRVAGQVPIYSQLYSLIRLYILDLLQVSCSPQQSPVR